MTDYGEDVRPPDGPGALAPEGTRVNGLAQEFIGTDGRIGRLGYIGRLPLFVALVVVGWLIFGVGDEQEVLTDLGLNVLGLIAYVLAASIVSSASIRRFHDFGWNGAAVFLLLVPLFGLVPFSMLIFRPGSRRPNLHGDSPTGLGIGRQSLVTGVSPVFQAWQRLRRKKIAMVTLVTILFVYTVGILADPISTHSYSDTDLLHTREGPSSDHILGTDWLGRDTFTRVAWGIQTTVIITLIGVLTGGVALGVTLGLVAGYIGGKVDTAIMRVGEVVASFPDVLLIILIAATLRPRINEWARDFESWSGWNGIIESGVIDYFVVTIAIVPFAWFGMMRLVRGQVLGIRNADYVEAARAVGVSTPRLLFSHILPNVAGPIIVSVSFGLGSVAGAEIFLSFLGLGVQPPHPSLGFMIADVTGRGSSVVSVFREHPEQLLAPVAVVWLLIFSWNLLGDALNDVFNPRTR